MQRLLRLMGLVVRCGQFAVLAVSLYQATISTLGYRRYQHTRLQNPEPPEDLPKFALIVCARNEEVVVSRIVSDLLNAEYPAERRDVVVVAHNCTDDTASVAARAGAAVVEHQTAMPGKVHAVEAALAALEPGYDFVGVFDADTRVGPDFLLGIAARAPGEDCLQAEVVPIADADWLAEGYGFGRKARNLFWWRPREALGLNTTITGTGWFMRPEVLRRYLTGSWTLTEDLELTARMVADGYRVAYVSRAPVACGEPRDLKASVNQRSRWVRGHIHVVMGRWVPLARRGLAGDFRALDLALYLIVPTRVLTRVGVTMCALLGIVSPAHRLPGMLVWTAMAGEFAVPAWIGWREHLVRLSSGSLTLAARHSLLGLLWFPIGIWAMGTARLRAWHAMPRLLEREANNVG